ncbi:MAG: D-tyrosyl-tRNA(Tyr) deacylase [Gammaproteobacteria bacterium]|nr:MAG: D-tyrosyl-tRNA(Tyr) deacylase [Gammaproteobacteria bacterium]RLA21551.1 MAG: D-tyrosyl-tRNA(Tyr) deacylase [Gammaproteobacteria bacterium]
MISVIQRVASAEVIVGGESIGKIERGILALVAIERGDSEKQVSRMAERLLSYRIFPDAEDKMNLSVTDINGGILLVPQFTLAADTQKGTRPSFGPAAPPALGEQLFNQLLDKIKVSYEKVGQGKFGADMQVSLCNSGPVTFILKA